MRIKRFNEDLGIDLEPYDSSMYDVNITDGFLIKYIDRDKNDMELWVGMGAGYANRIGEHTALFKTEREAEKRIREILGAGMADSILRDNYIIVKANEFLSTVFQLLTPLNAFNENTNLEDFRSNVFPPMREHYIDAPGVMKIKLLVFEKEEIEKYWNSPDRFRHAFWFKTFEEAKHYAKSYLDIINEKVQEGYNYLDGLNEEGAGRDEKWFKND